MGEDRPPIAPEGGLPMPWTSATMPRGRSVRIEERKRGDTMMTKLPEVIHMSDLQEDTPAVLQRLRESGTPAVITQEGRAAAVLIDIESFRRMESEREILALLARGEREIA